MRRRCIFYYIIGLLSYTCVRRTAKFSSLNCINDRYRYMALYEMTRHELKSVLTISPFKVQSILNVFFYTTMDIGQVTLYNNLHSVIAIEYNPSFCHPLSSGRAGSVATNWDAIGERQPRPGSVYGETHLLTTPLRSGSRSFGRTPPRSSGTAHLTLETDQGHAIDADVIQMPPLFMGTGLSGPVHHTKSLLKRCALNTTSLKAINLCAHIC